MFDWICPICGNKNQGETPEFDVCPVCDWEDDPQQRNDHDYDGGANWHSVNMAKVNFEKFGKIMTDEDNNAEATFRAAHVTSDGKWIDNCGQELCRCQKWAAKDKT